MAEKPSYEELERKVKELQENAAKIQQAEKTLQESEKRYRNIYDNAQVGLYRSRVRDGKIVMVNNRMAEIFGYQNTEECIAKYIAAEHYVHPETRDKLLEILHEHGKVTNFESEIRKDDGSIAWLQYSGVLSSEGGYLEGVCIDITDRKLTEEALSKSETKYRTLIKNAGEAIIVAQDGRIKFANPKGEALYGRSQKELITRPLTDFIHEADREMVGGRHKRRLRGQKVPSTYAFRIINKTVNTVWVQLSAVPFFWEDKPAVLCYMTDITQRKKTEEALIKSEVWVRNIFKSLNEAVFVITLERKYLDMNEAAEKMFGYTKKELINVSSKIVHVDHENYLKFGKKIEKVINNTGEITNFQFVMKRKNGDIFPSEHTISLMRDNDGKPIGIVSVVRDISEQKQIETEKQNLHIQLQQAQKMEAIGTLAGGIAHEFNNALTGVVGNIQLLEMKLAGHESVKEYTEPIMASSQRMADLTNKLLAYARGGMYQPKTLYLSEFMQDCLPIIKHDIKPGILIETDFPRNISPVDADPTQVQMVISAILNNASEAIEGEGRIRIEVRNLEIEKSIIKKIPELKPGLYICLKITDDGPGMKEEDRNKIFDPFFTTKFQGRGMGMAAVYGIVINHGGWITVDSERGVGTAVRIYFPVAEIQVKKEMVEAAKEQLTLVIGTLLIIEDDELVMEVTCAILEKLGYRMLKAETGEEAIAIAKTFDGQIDLALLDIKLPDMNGETVYPVLIKARPDLKVIVCSGCAIDGPAQGILDAGAQDFIQKPFSVETLSGTLQKVLENS